MADNNATQQEPTTDNQSGAPEQAEKTFTQSEVDKIVQQRLAKERNSESYKTLEQKAKAYDEAEEANKTELQKALERIQQLETDNKRQQHDNLIASACLRHNIPAEYADMVTGSDEESVNKSAERLAKLVNHQSNSEQSQQRDTQPLNSEGSQPAHSISIDEQIKAAEAKGDVASAIALKSMKLVQTMKK